MERVGLGSTAVQNLSHGFEFHGTPINEGLMRDLTGGYDIVTVNGGAEALAQIALRPVPLVITDYNMPGMNGLQLTAAIKETSPDTRVVLITAYATPELEKRAREQRVDHYLPKPFPLDRLEQIVRDVLR